MPKATSFDLSFNLSRCLVVLFFVLVSLLGCFGLGLCSWFLPPPTTIIYQHSETSKRQLEEVKAAMVLKTEESERWMSERTILGNRQNDLRQEIRKLSIQLAAKTEECSKTKVDLLQLEGKVELCLYYTCWWSSLCNFQYRSSL